nr:hypothetical protein [Tanacetum cinerariifolium]
MCLTHQLSPDLGSNKWYQSLVALDLGVYKVFDFLYFCCAPISAGDPNPAVTSVSDGFSISAAFSIPVATPIAAGIPIPVGVIPTGELPLTLMVLASLIIFRIMLHGGYFEYWKAGLVVVPPVTWLPRQHWSTPVNDGQRRRPPSVNDGQRRRPPSVNAAGHRSTAPDNGGDRRSTVAVNDGCRWRTTVDCRWTTVDHHRTTGQRCHVSTGQRRSTTVNAAGHRRSTTVNSAGHRRSTPPATGQRRRITVVIGGQRWRSTTVASGEPPLTAAGPPLTTTGLPVNGGWWAGQRAGLGRSGRVWIGSGSGPGRVRHVSATLQALSDIYYLFGGFMDYLWSSWASRICDGNFGCRVITNALIRSGLIPSFRLKASATTISFPG